MVSYLDSRADENYSARTLLTAIDQARSSVGEHYLDTVGVGGSIPPVPTDDGLLEAPSNIDGHSTATLEGNLGGEVASLSL